MKKLLFLLLGLLLASFASAQITITRADLPRGGDVVTYSLADTLLGIDMRATGPNYSWDYSRVNGLFQETDTFLDRDELPFTLQFTVPRAANTFIYTDLPFDSLPTGASIPIDGGFELFGISNNAYVSYGYAINLSGFGVPFVSDPTDTIFPLPLSYPALHTDSSSTEFALPFPIMGFDFYALIERKREVEVDGWGTVQTPLGSFDAIRVRTATTGFDSVRVDSNIAFRTPTPRTITYQWWAQGKSGPVLEVNSQIVLGDTFVTSVRFQDTLESTVSVEPAPQLSVDVYPNPVRDVLFVRGLRAGSSLQFQLLDLRGRTVRAGRLYGERNRISVADLAEGNYVLRLENDRGVIRWEKLRVE